MSIMSHGNPHDILFVSSLRATLRVAGQSPTKTGNLISTRNMNMKRFIVILGMTSVILSACWGTNPAPPPSSPTLLPTQSFTPAPTSAPTETSTAIPSPTPIPNPLEISAMRAREYPGSDIVIETVLDPGVNYQRYYVSYLSEGLKIYALMTIPTGEKPANGWPVIIFNHGYIPPDVYVTTQRYVAYVDLIARSGYII